MWNLRVKRYVIIKERCKNCGGCQSVCPENAIFHAEGDVCEIDQSLCSFCGFCIDACRAQAIKKKFSIYLILTNFKLFRGGGNIHG